MKYDKELLDFKFSQIDKIANTTVSLINQNVYPQWVQKEYVKLCYIYDAIYKINNEIDSIGNHFDDSFNEDTCEIMYHNYLTAIFNMSIILAILEDKNNQINKED